MRVIGVDPGWTRCSSRVTMSATGGTARQLHHTGAFEDETITLDAEL